MALPNPVYCDVCADGTQVTSTVGVGVAAEVYFGALNIALPSAGSYVRAVSEGGAQFAVVQGADGNAYLISNAGAIVTLGVVSGIRAVAIKVVSGALWVVWVNSSTTYTHQRYTTALGALEPPIVETMPLAILGSVAGILDLEADGTPIFVDARRTLTVKGYPLSMAVQAGVYWVGLSAGFLARQVVAIEALSGKAYTLYLGVAFDPHAVEADDGSGRVYFAARTSTEGAIFITGPPLPALTGKLATEGVGVGDEVQELYALASERVVEAKQGDIMSREWFTWAVRLTQEVYRPVGLESATGILGESQGGTGGVSGIQELNAGNLLQGVIPQGRKWLETVTTAVGTQNDLDFLSADSLIANNATALTLNGLVAGVDGQRVVVLAQGAGTVTIADEAAGSAAANRIVTDTGGNIVLSAGIHGVVLVYNGAANRWRVVGRGSAGGAGDVVGPASSVDSEVVLFSGVSGKIVKRATGSGVVYVTSGVFAVDTVLAATRGGNPEVRAALTAPVNGSYAWINQGSSSIRDDTDSVVLAGAATGSGANLALRKKSAPSAPYTITAYMLPTILAKDFHSYGLHFRQSSDGKLHVLDVLEGTVLRSTKFASPTSFSADYQTFPLSDVVRWLRIEDDNTDRVLYVSADGVDWLEIHRIGRTDYLTADEVGFHVGTENSATPNLAPILRVQSWAEA